VRVWLLFTSKVVISSVLSTKKESMTNKFFYDFSIDSYHGYVKTERPG
jgi:hypothetical protein